MPHLLPLDRPVPLFDLAATRRIEAAAQAALAPHTLMQRAGLATARLALALADKDLKELEPLLPSEELSQGLGQRLLRVRSFLLNDTEKALEELRKMSENLAMISDSLR